MTKLDVKVFVCKKQNGIAVMKLQHEGVQSELCL